MTSAVESARATVYLRFDEVEIVDFKALRGKHTLVLDHRGVTHIVGNNLVTPRLAGNGASKSTLWDAITWCIYGKTPRGLNNTDIKPWAGGRPSVTLFITRNNKARVIKRVTHPKHLLTLDGEEVADVLSFMGMGFELFVNTIVLPQERPLFFDRGPTDKMALFTEVLDLDRWDERSDAAAKSVTELEHQLGDVEVDIRRGLGAIDEIDRVIERARQRSKEWVEASQRKVTASKREIEALKAELTNKSADLDTAILAEDGALLELKACEADLTKLRRDIAAEQRTLSGLEGTATAKARELRQANDDIAGLKRATICPACEQPVTPKNLDAHRKRLAARTEELLSEIRRNETKIGECSKELASLQKRVRTVEGEAEGFDNTARDAGDVITRLKPEVATLNARLKEATEVRDEINPHLDQLNELTTRKKHLEADQKQLESEQTKLQADIETDKYWIKGFREIKLQLISDVLEELELTTNGMIEEIGMDGYRALFEIDREAKNGNVTPMIHVQIVSPESNDQPVKWAAYSGGEAQRLRFVGSLALSDVLLGHADIETNLEVLDEPAKYWARQGVKELTAFLAERARERDKSIFFIEHSAVESSNFSRVITMVKDEDGSRIEEE